MSYNYRKPYENELIHYGVQGMKWGVRRYQNLDGTLTPAGKIQYASESSIISSHKNGWRSSDSTGDIVLKRSSGSRQKITNDTFAEAKTAGFWDGKKTAYDLTTGKNFSYVDKGSYVAYFDPASGEIYATDRNEFMSNLVNNDDKKETLQNDQSITIKQGQKVVSEVIQSNSNTKMSDIVDGILSIGKKVVNSIISLFKRR